MMVSSFCNRHMCLDYGQKRIGIAFSDASGTVASAHSVLESKGTRFDFERIKILALENEVKTIVIGLPLNADGTESVRSAVTREFGSKLEKVTGINVEFEDERFSSLEAEQILKEKKLSWQQRKSEIDKISAAIILQNYLNKNKRGKI